MNLCQSAIAVALLLTSTQGLAEKYRIIEVSPSENYRHNFAMSMNDLGDFVGVARESFGFRFYLEPYITGEETALRTGCDISQEEIDSNSFDADSTYCLRGQLASSEEGSSPAYQKVGDIKSFMQLSGATSMVNLADVNDAGLGGFTRSNNETLNGINNNSIAVGAASAPYAPSSFTYTNDDEEEVTYRYFAREFKKRAVVFNGTDTSFIEPVDASYGGVSGAYDISNSGYVAGYESVDVFEEFQTLIDDNCDGSLQPVDVCAWGYSVNENIFEIRPVIWELDADLQVINQTRYDIAFEPNEEQQDNYSAYPTSVNDSGIAVGFGDVPLEISTTSTANFPLIFQNGETKQIIQEQDEYFGGFAFDINNSNVVVGKLIKRVGFNSFEDVIFTYDIDTSELSTPTIFYKNSQGSANAINDNGLVVGEAEYEVTSAITRRKHGFVYDIHSNEFSDLNDLVSCNSGYDIVEVRDINNNDQIFANAMKKVDKLDALGNPTLDSNGDVEQEYVMVAVMLDPVEGGQIDECIDPNDQPYERKGLSHSLLSILGLSFLVVMRRRFI
jgi:hypothetical protein